MSVKVELHLLASKKVMKNRGCSPDDDSISEWSLAEEPGSPAYTVLLLLEVVEPFNKALVCLQAEEIQKI